MSRPSGVIKETFLADMGFIEKPFHYFALSLLGLFLIILPFVTSEYILSQIILIAIFGVAIMGLNLLTTAQLFSVMHAALIGVGAFTAAFLSQSLPFFITIPLAGLMAAGASVLFGLPSVRVKGFYLLFSTTAAQFILEWIFNWMTRDIPGSAVYVEAMGIAGYTFSAIERYYIFIIIALIMGYLIAHIGRTPLGKALVMIGEKDYAAQIQGLSLLKFKSIAFAISGFYAGVAGAMWGYNLGMVTPEHFPFLMSWELLGIGVIVGGLGSYVWGSLLGATMMIAVTQGTTVLVGALTPYLPWLGAGAFGLRAVIYGLIIAAILILEPHGLASLVRKIKRFFDLWPFSY
jgi:branched-chain amino acid transport system permease protein